MIIYVTWNTDIRVAPVGDGEGDGDGTGDGEGTGDGDGTGKGTGDGTGDGNGTGDGDGEEQRSDGIDVGFHISVPGSQIALLSPDPDVHVYVTIVPTAFPMFEAVAPVGATGGSEAHSDSQTAFISASTIEFTASTIEFTSQLYLES